MKTLIFNGSPRKNGDTVSLIEEFARNVEGEVKLVNAYSCDIKPCVDCRFCWEHEGCCQKDGMHEIYDYINECDTIVIASPIYFAELSGQLLAILSRLQAIFCASYFRKVKPILRDKKGVIILVGGGEGPMKKASETATTLLHQMYVQNIYPAVFAYNTNLNPSKDDMEVMNKVKELALLCSTER